MKAKVVFEDSPADSESGPYLDKLPLWQREPLTKFIDELLSAGSIDHSDARLTADGKWSLWVRDQAGAAINHVCYVARGDEALLSDFAKSLLQPQREIRSTSTNTNKELMVSNAESVAISAGKADDFLSVSHFASLLDVIQRELFLKAVSDFKAGRSSSDYSLQVDGSAKVHIVRDTPFPVSFVCTLQWV